MGKVDIVTQELNRNIKPIQNTYRHNWIVYELNSTLSLAMRGLF